MTEHRRATPEDLRHVARNLSPIDAREQFCLRKDDDVERLALELVTLHQAHALDAEVFIGPSGRPAAILTVYLLAPGLGLVRRIATEEWPKVMPAMFRYAVTTFIPIVLAPLRRAECQILAEHAQARRILARLGFIEEGVARRRGRNGEDLVSIAWLNPNFPLNLSQDGRERPVGPSG